MEKLTLQNRKGQTIVGLYARPEGELKGTCVIQHGWSGRKEQPHVMVLQDVFLKHGFQTFNFDATNSFNESDGEYENSSLGLHYEDFEDVVKWVQEQEWFTMPLALTGHSKGGYSAARYAENYPEEVSLVAPIAPVVSGKLSLAAHERFDPEGLQKWKETGVRIEESTSTPGLIKHAPWSAFEERLNHDLLPDAGKLTMPVFLLVGSEDTGMPPEHIQKLYNAIPEGKKTFKIIEGAPHTYVTDHDLQKLGEYLDEWLSEQSL